MTPLYFVVLLFAKCKCRKTSKWPRGLQKRSRTKVCVTSVFSFAFSNLSTPSRLAAGSSNKHVLRERGKLRENDHDGEFNSDDDEEQRFSSAGGKKPSKR